ncbi:MAG: putative iron-dependent peroxidase [Planctomycetota bacterium]|jgi:putative iron-dependent peroxidase
MTSQPGILPDLPAHSRFLEFRLTGTGASAFALLATIEPSDDYVVGLGPNLLEQAGVEIEGMTAFPTMSHGEISVPSTQLDLWIWVRGDTAEDVIESADRLVAQLQAEFALEHATSGFKYDGGRDLTGYEDGTENPVGDAAVAAAFSGGSSFVAVQKWQHDMAAFDRLSPEQQDDVFGRRRDTNEEYDAPATAHVKRTAQEDFDPEAFLLRRSSPWRDASGCGLMFVAFGRSFYAFDVQMRRMLGLEDGLVDQVFTISKPTTGGYYWCPPVDAIGRLVLR